MCDTEVTRLKTQGLAHIEERVKNQLLRHDAEFFARHGGLGVDIGAKHRDCARSGFGQSSQDTDEGRFASAVGPEQSKKLALLNIKTHTIECLKRPTGGLKSFGNGLEGDGWHGKPYILRLCQGLA